MKNDRSPLHRFHLPLCGLVVLAALWAALARPVRADEIDEIEEEDTDIAENRGVVPLDRVPLDLADNVTLGDDSAPVTVIEFLDFECGFCGRHVEETVPKLSESYIADGRVRYVELDFPLTRIHRNAFVAARAAHCAGRQGKYWEMRTRLFEPGAQFEEWGPHAAAVGLDTEPFEACIAGPESAAAVNADAQQAQRVRAPGTPTLVVARTDLDDPKRVTAVSMLAGKKAWELVEGAIEAALIETAVPAGSGETAGDG